MAGDTDDSGGKGKRFPFIDLEKALDRAAALYEADRQGRAMPVSVAFEIWEYSDKSSGGHQTIAALRSYGILSSENDGEARRISLSPEALRYFKDERDEERLKLRKLFAMLPKLLRALWDRWQDSPPSDNVARSYLKIDLGLGEQQARSLLGIYKENLAFAELKGTDKVADIKVVEAEEPGYVDSAVKQTPNSPAPSRSMPPIGMKEDTFTLDEGDVVLQWPERLSQASYEDLESWMQLQLRKIKRRIE